MKHHDSIVIGKGSGNTVIDQRNIESAQNPLLIEQAAA
jgi:hypothetical protein